MPTILSPHTSPSPQRVPLLQGHVTGLPPGIVYPGSLLVLRDSFSVLLDILCFSFLMILSSTPFSTFTQWNPPHSEPMGGKVSVERVYFSTHSNVC